MAKKLEQHGQNEGTTKPLENLRDFFWHPDHYARTLYESFKIPKPADNDLAFLILTRYYVENRSLFDQLLSSTPFPKEVKEFLVKTAQKTSVEHMASGALKDKRLHCVYNKHRKLKQVFLAWEYEAEKIADDEYRHLSHIRFKEMKEKFNPDADPLAQEVQYLAELRNYDSKYDSLGEFEEDFRDKQEYLRELQEEHEAEFRKCHQEYRILEDFDDSEDTEKPEEPLEMAALKEYHADIAEWWDSIRDRKPNDHIREFAEKEFAPPYDGYDKPPSTKDELYYGFQGIAHTVHLTIPADSADWYNDFHGLRCHKFSWEDPDTVLNYYSESLDPHNMKRPGVIGLPKEIEKIKSRILNINTALSQHGFLNVPHNITDVTQKDLEDALRDFKEKTVGQEITLALPVRRNAKLSEEKIAEGCSINDYFDNDEWASKNPGASFYRHYFNRHFIGDKTDEPIRWATDRTKLMAGYSYKTVSMVGGTILHDYPIRAIKHQFEKMAPLACNTVNPNLLNAKSYVFTAKKSALYSQALLIFGKDLPVELTYFILENSQYIEPEFLTNPKLKLLEPCLKNGLMVDRMTQLFKMMNQNSSSPKEAFDYTVYMILAIYSGEEPWWFKEDFDITKIFNGNEKTKISKKGLLTGFDERGKAIAKRIAEKAGFAFVYARATYKNYGYKLSKIQGVSEESAIDFTCEITQKVGIGNVKRIGNIVSYAMKHVSELPPGQREEALKSLCDFIAANSSDSPIINCMEGDDIGFFIPSFGIMMHAIVGDKKARETPFDEMTLNYGHLQQAARFFGRPYEERANLLPAIKVHIPNSRMLGASIQRADRKLLSRNTEAMTTPDSVKTPSNSIINLFKRAERECGYLSERILNPYFAFIAPKLRDPLNPPEGIFKLLQKFENIPDPEAMTSINERLFAHPNRKWIHAENSARAYVDRWLIISNLFDLYAFGVVSETEAMDYLKWVTEEEELPEAILEEDENPFDEDDDRDDEMDDDLRTAFTPSKIAAREKADLKRSRKLYYKEANKDARFKKVCNLEKLTKILVGVKILLVTKMLSAENYKSVVANLFEMAKNLKIDFSLFKVANRDLLKTGDYDQMINALKEVLGLKVVDMAKLKQAFAEAETIERAMELIEGCLRLSDIMEALGATIETTESNITKIVFSRNDYDSMEFAFLIRDQLKILNDEVFRLFGSFEFVREDFIKDLVAKIPKINLWTSIINILQNTASRANKKAATPIDRATNFSVSAMRAVNLIVQGTNMGVSLISENKELPKMLTGETGAMLMRVPQLTPGEDSALGPIDTSHMNSEQAITAANALLRRIETAESALEETLRTQHAAIVEQIFNARVESLGLLPVGGKIHFINALPAEKLRIFKTLTTVESTPFHMIHANHSMILPPSPSSKEMMLLLFTLDVTDAIDKDYPELQIGIAGRLSPENAAILGSSVLLATEKTYDYSPDAFKTSQDCHTGARIMAYDADMPIVRLPFVGDLEGRTDMLGRRSPHDIELYQLLGTVLVHGQFGGPFGKLAQKFIKKHAAIIKKYKLQDAFTEKWIYSAKDDMRDDQASERHYQCVKKITEAWVECYDNVVENGVEEGVVFEMRELFDWLRAEILPIQAQLLTDPKACQDIVNVLTIAS